ncbi:DUF2516 family protein [Geodermatophilus sp. YIM 151500]|uniref:DUF2516 family protein n=1 Tax=Geodermatophilus sp. YIM 151500 TaxID=2984531 RepID=UPI0021E4B3A4|nr:DUF2516 family protein [Geodermatophilus sp. YIM 151500]MCV2490382.1 DUF2516 family protein [Geodermatophilus sp. YIM 151500]
MAAFDGFLLLLLQFATLGLAAWALVDALIRPASAYVAAGKLTKPAWGAITGLALVLAWLTPPLSFFWLPAVIGAVVYLVDVRPAVRGLQRGGNSPW